MSDPPVPAFGVWPQNAAGDSAAADPLAAMVSSMGMSSLAALIGAAGRDNADPAATPRRRGHPTTPTIDGTAAVAPPPDSVRVREYGGTATAAGFRPATATLFATAPDTPVVAGLYQRLGNRMIVVYRDGEALRLTVDQQTFDIGPTFQARWEPLNDSRSRLVVSDRGHLLAEAVYPTPAAQSDLGLFLRDMLADPVRRSQIFRP
jgi:hypothetical protein